MNIGLHNLASFGSNKSKKRLGRGEGSGLGKTSGRGHKGQKARKSGNVRIGFEGGQNPLSRRIPKYGFSNKLFEKKYCIVNLSQIQQSSLTKITPQELYYAGLVRNMKFKVKILGKGRLTKSCSVCVHAISKSARESIIEQGGSVDIVGSVPISNVLE